MKHPLEIIETVRAVWPADRPLFVRISSVDGIDGGIDIATAPRAIAAGANVLVAGTATFRGGPEAYADNIRRLRAP